MTIFPSYKSTGLILFIWGMILGSLVTTLFTLPTELGITITLALRVAWIPALLIIGTVWFNARYIIKGNTLIIKFDPYEQKSEFISLLQEFNPSI